jgi:NTP pyrophosphatase (non-canonical NTP hydrolase)
MNLKNEFQPIREWATEKGIFAKSDAIKQYLKLQEECGELAKALLTSNEEEIKDAIGDCIVVLTNLAELSGMNVEDCINSAYEVISKRKGSMVNGAFVKEK